MGKYQAYSEYTDSEVSGLGIIPSHWEVMQLKRTVYGCVNGIWGSEPKEDGCDTIVLRVADFDRPKLSLKEDGYTYRKIEDKEMITRKLKRGDLLLEKSGGGEKTLVGQVVLFDKDFQAVTSNFVAKMTPNEGFNSRFLNYVFSRFYSDNINYCSIKQNTGIQNLDSAAYLAEKFGFPLELEQQKIANFLDHETAKIDTLIEKQQQLIKLLKEKRQAVISHAVTKGLNPNAPMRDSGVEWLGEVPEHWEITKFKYLGKAQNGLTYSPTDIVDENEGVLVLRSSNIQNGRLKFDDNVYVSTAPPERMITVENDILICSRNGSRALIGKNALIPKSSAGLTYGAFMMIYRGEYNSYLYWVLNSSLFDYQSGSFLTSTINQLTVGNMDSFEIPFPLELKERNDIAEYLSNETISFDKAIGLAENQIELLRERRTALISAAVTGKIDVRSWQEPESSDQNKDVAV
jgi:type I restriction enzyme S subunit